MATSRRSAAVKKPKRKKAESVEQRQFVTQVYFFYPDLLCFHPANGGYRGVREAIGLKAEGVLAGIPDIYIDEARGGWFGLRLEFKKPGEQRAINGGLSDDQIKIRERLARKGYLIHTVYSCEEAMQRLHAYMTHPLTLGVISVSR